MASATRMDRGRAGGWLPRRGERAAPAVSGVLLALCYPPLHPLVLPFAALVPLALWLSGRPATREGRASARRGSALFALVHFGLVFHWLLPALTMLTPAGPVLWALGLALLGVLTVLWAVAFHHATAQLRAPLALALPVTWTGLEWGMAHLPGPLAMPWLGLGTTLTGYPELAGIAELAGARGVTFWIAAVNGLLAAAILRPDGGDPASSMPRRRTAAARRGRRVRWVGVVVVAVVPAAWGVRRAATLETWSVGRVALVQPAMPQSVRLDSALVIEATFDRLDALVRALEPGTLRLAVLPEMVLPIEPARTSSGEPVDPRDAEALARLEGYVRELGAPVLFGARGRGPDDGLPRNSAFLLETDGLADFRYDKHHLVPVVERSLVLPVGVPLRYRPRGDYAAGRAWPLADVEGVAVGVSICFEAAFADVSRALRREGADVLVNLTNDAWFGDDPSAARGAGLWQHPAHLVMRAIETRAGVVRVANTGFSFVVDPTGRTAGVSAPLSSSASVAELRTSDVNTLFVRLGDVTGRASAAGLLLLLLSALLRRRTPSGGDGGR